MQSYLQVLQAQEAASNLAAKLPPLGKRASGHHNAEVVCLHNAVHLFELMQALSSSLWLLIRDSHDCERINPALDLANHGSANIDRSIRFPEGLDHLLHRNPRTHLWPLQFPHD